MLNEAAMARVYEVLAEYNLTLQQFNALNIYASGKLVDMLSAGSMSKEETAAQLKVIHFIIINLSYIITLYYIIDIFLFFKTKIG